MERDNLVIMLKKVTIYSVTTQGGCLLAKAAGNSNEKSVI